MRSETGLVLVLGATSPLARGACEELARSGSKLLLAGRDLEELNRNASDLRIRFGCEASAARFDATTPHDHEELLRSVLRAAPLDGVVACIGAMGDPEESKSEMEAARTAIDVNFTAQAAILTAIAEHMAERSGGFVIGVGSVAGDRGRQSNYVYGSAKGGFALWLQGLRNRMHRRGVRVLTVKPGFLDTRMTFGTRSGPLVADPFRAGRTMIRRLKGRGDVIYLPWFWRWIMLVIRAIPEPLFKRLSL